MDQVMPANVNGNSSTPLPKPIADHPTWVGIAVGVQNYSCSAEGIWTTLGAGAVTEIFDTSCVPLSAQGAYATYIYKVWTSASPDMSASELVSVSGMLNLPGALGQHYFAKNPTNASDPALYAVWDFRGGRLKNDPNVANAWGMGLRVGQVPSPDDPVLDSTWLALTPFLVDGKPVGQIADQVFRVNTNGGNPPASCKPGSPMLNVRSVNTFWFYGGAWKDTIG
ncbi:hypothetical protein PsYK624_115810 [Phanerochaete sordida]|uniref:Uncharacterized protein n=1 Tax=Phanerochaete sordida TaxID=48140 RepID=A0A9P3LIP8_9APHY|nr:hypothetical protein PsYK624_115810 [Phanerochaete sordida]